jgi:hypothetical protein
VQPRPGKAPEEGASARERSHRAAADTNDITARRREERAILELETVAQLTDPIFVSPKDVQLALWLAEREIVNAYIAMKSAWWP